MIILQSANDIVRQDLEEIVSELNKDLLVMAGSSLLITGGAGFLGYYLVQTIILWNTQVDDASKIRVTVMDNFIRGIPKWLEKLRGIKDLVIVNFNVISPIDKTHSYEYIIHAASIASPTYYRQYPIETMDANVIGLRNLLDYGVHRSLTKNHVKGFLYFSTSEIYGDPDPSMIPTPETYRGNVSCTGPRACYDESKRFGETLCVNFAQQYGLPIKIARPFNNYGPGLKITDRRALPDFAMQVFRDEDVVLHSNGSPTRTFCYISDAVIGYYKILLRGRIGESYNIGTSAPEISIRELAEMTIACSRKLFGYGGEVVYSQSNDAQYLVDNPNRRCPDISKAQREIGYDPKIGIEEGLSRTMIWYKFNCSEDSIG